MGHTVLPEIAKLGLVSLVLSSTIAIGAVANAQMTTTIIHEPVKPAMKTIVANSPEDIALKEEIRKIRAYNRYVDGQIGISDVIEVFEPVPAAPVPKKISLFNPEENMGQLRITYSTPQGQLVSVSPVSTRVERGTASNHHSASFHDYKIAQGDTLYSLAKNNCVNMSAIQSLNAMSDANLRVGQAINIPSNRCQVQHAHTEVQAVTQKSEVVRVVMPVPNQTNATGRNVGASNNYAVLPKDTLYSIGLSYCVSPEQLATQNEMAISDAIHPGQILSLPTDVCQK